MNDIGMHVNKKLIDKLEDKQYEGRIFRRC